MIGTELKVTAKVNLNLISCPHCDSLFNAGSLKETGLYSMRIDYQADDDSHYLVFWLNSQKGYGV